MTGDEADSGETDDLQDLARKQRELDQRLDEVGDYFDSELDGIKHRQKEIEKEIEVEGLELVNQQLEEINKRLNRLSDIITNNRDKIRQLKDLSKKDEVLE